MSRICKIYTIFTIPHVCSSGSPDPERIKRKILSEPVVRGPVPRDRPIRAKTERQPGRRVCSSGSPDPERARGEPFPGP